MKHLSELAITGQRVGRLALQGQQRHTAGKT